MGAQLRKRPLLGSVEAGADAGPGAPIAQVDGFGEAEPECAFVAKPEADLNSNREAGRLREVAAGVAAGAAAASAEDELLRGTAGKKHCKLCLVVREELVVRQPPALHLAARGREQETVDGAAAETDGDERMSSLVDRDAPVAVERPTGVARVGHGSADCGIDTGGAAAEGGTGERWDVCLGQIASAGRLEGGWTRQRIAGVDGVGRVGGADEKHALAPGRAIEELEEGVYHLPAVMCVVMVGSGAGAHGVDLVDEEDRRPRRPRLGEAAVHGLEHLAEMAACLPLSEARGDEGDAGALPMARAR